MQSKSLQYINFSIMSTFRLDKVEAELGYLQVNIL